MKALTLEETRLKEEMKERCLSKGQYKDEKAKDKFKMLCHLEDFEVQYWKLQKENKKLNGVIQTYDILLKTNAEENKRLKDNWNNLKEYMIKEQARIVIENTDEDEFVYTELLIKMQELEQGSGSDE